MSGTPARRLFVRDLVVECRIGIHRHEQDRGQRVRVDLELDIRDEGPVDDKIANVVNYDEVVADVRAVAAAGHVNLVETLAERIAEACLADRRVSAARVRVEKLDALAGATGAGVEIERFA